MKENPPKHHSIYINPPIVIVDKNWNCRWNWIVDGRMLYWCFRWRVSEWRQREMVWWMLIWMYTSRVSDSGWLVVVAVVVVVDSISAKNLYKNQESRIKNYIQLFLLLEILIFLFFNFYLRLFFFLFFWFFPLLLGTSGWWCANFRLPRKEPRKRV